MIHVGTSGFNYPEWRGRFYRPTGGHEDADVSTRRASARWRSTTRSTGCRRRSCRGWRPRSRRLHVQPQGTAPDHHDRRLKDCADLVRASASGVHAERALGVSCSSSPRTSNADLGVFDAFLDHLPRAPARPSSSPPVLVERRGVRAAARRNLRSASRTTRTAQRRCRDLDYGYLRLRDAGYDAEALRRWAGRGRQPVLVARAFVYFKHEDEARGPEFAASFLGGQDVGRRSVRLQSV